MPFSVPKVDRGKGAGREKKNILRNTDEERKVEKSSEGLGSLRKQQSLSDRTGRKGTDWITVWLRGGKTPGGVQKLSPEWGENKSSQTTLTSQTEAPRRPTISKFRLDVNVLPQSHSKQFNTKWAAFRTQSPKLTLKEKQKCAHSVTASKSLEANEGAGIYLHRTECGNS